MSVRLDGDLVRLEGHCHLEDAEALVSLLQAEPGRRVDFSACRQLHAAVAQALLALAPECVALPEDAFLRERLVPALGLRAQGT
jgi:hypothetical protein